MKWLLLDILKISVCFVNLWWVYSCNLSVGWVQFSSPQDCFCLNCASCCCAFCFTWFICTKIKNNNTKTDVEELRHENDLDADRDFIIRLGYVTQPPSIILTHFGLRAQDYTLAHKLTHTLNWLNENAYQPTSPLFSHCLYLCIPPSCICGYCEGWEPTTSRGVKYCQLLGLARYFTQT